MRAFVTVGTTEFDELIAAIDCEAFVHALRALHCTHLVVQLGRGSTLPIVLPEQCAAQGIDFSQFRFKDTLAEEMSAADVVVSHCGAGSALEALGMGKVLVLIVNPSLQGNHQSELANALTTAPHNYALATSPQGLLQTLRDLNLRQAALEPYPCPDRDAFPALVDGMFDWR